MMLLLSSTRPGSLSDIRKQLDQLANDIIKGLKKRSEFPQNSAVYSDRASLVKGFPRLSLLAHQLAQLDRSSPEHIFLLKHLLLNIGAIDVALLSELQAPLDNTEQAFLIPQEPFLAQLLAYYQQWIRRHCRSGEEPSSYAETALFDAQVLLALSERIYLGQRVIECKMEAARTEFETALGDEQALRALIIRPQREQKVISNVRQLAKHCGFSVGQAERWWRWIIDMTIAVEIDYIHTISSDSNKHD